jgi:hypothetical protein
MARVHDSIELVFRDYREVFRCGVDDWQRVAEMTI